MKERVKELKSAGRESDLLAKIAEMPPTDRAIAERLHALIKETAPALSPRRPVRLHHFPPGVGAHGARGETAGADVALVSVFPARRGARLPSKEHRQCLP